MLDNYADTVAALAGIVYQTKVMKLDGLRAGRRERRAGVAGLACFLCACNAASPDAATALPDVTFSMTGHVDADSELLSCVYVRMPTDRGKIAVGSAESQFTPGSHHFLVFRTTYKDPPPGGDVPHLCTDAEQIANISGSYYEAQQPVSQRVLPAGVAHIFAPGEVLLMTAHYLDANATGYDTRVDFRLHTEPLSQVQHEAGSFFFYDYDIDVPPFSQVTVTRTCPLPKDVEPALLWSHMHSRGVGFTAKSDDPTAVARLGDLYDTTTWSEPEPRTFPDDPPVTLHAGSSITYSCTYRNTTSSTFLQGQSAATNEMCILHGMYWPRLDIASELCLGGTSTIGPATSLLAPDIDTSDASTYGDAAEAAPADDGGD